MAKRISLFDPYKLGNYSLKNRVVMCPMTRSRSYDFSPNDSTTLYYRQRASAGLIVTEAVVVSVEGRGYAFTPGLYNDEQISKWKQVTKAVHDEGGLIFAQLWHTGRFSHSSHQANGAPPVSSVANPGKDLTVFAFDENGAFKSLPTSIPRPLETHEIPRVAKDFAQAALNAIDAGFDGIEIHGANGYIFEQFINPVINTRADRYGGSTIDNRSRFLLETVDAVSDAIGSHRTAVRLSPFGSYGDIPRFDDEEDTFLSIARQLSKRSLVYAHSMDQGAIPEGFLAKFRANFTGTLIVAGDYDAKRGQAALDANLADLIAYGRPYISNPDLVERLKNGWPLTPHDNNTMYGGDDKGYTDYLPYNGSASPSL